MLKAFFFNLQAIQIYTFVTFIFAVIFYKRNSRQFKILISILFICSLTEILSTILQIYHYRIGLLYSITMFFHHSLWLLLLYQSIRERSLFKILYIAYAIFGFLNLFFIEGMEEFNSSSFIIGAFFYLVLFIYQSFYELRQENFAFFQTNYYLLLFAPVLFLFGISFVFGFKSAALAKTRVFGEITLYEFIVYFVNIIYYSLINIYIYREKKLKHA